MKDLGCMICDLRLWTVLALVACGPGVGPAPGRRSVRQKKDKPMVALVMKSLANEFFKTMEEGAKAHHEQHKDEYDLKVVGIKDETDVTQQVEYVELMIAQKVDAIVIAPGRLQGPGPGLQTGDGRRHHRGQHRQQVRRGGAQGQERARFPSSVRTIAKGPSWPACIWPSRLKAGDKVAVIEGAPNAYNGIQRKLGFEDAMMGSNLTIVSSQTGYWETDKAQPIASALINEHPDLKAILCANDSMALGAVAALKDAGKLGSIYVVGFDNIAAVQRLLKEGRSPLHGGPARGQAGPVRHRVRPGDAQDQGPARRQGDPRRSDHGGNAL